MLENAKVVYVAHPYGGLSSNYESISSIMRLLCEKFPNITFVSPIHAYGFMYEAVDYEKGISRGCKMEKEYAIQNNKGVEVL